ncbi:MAG: glucose 1-dehydrogenase [Sphingobacteriales bacterium]|nr:glucose 1-dehydrogenase [Sphingobacteriales bacterium]
MSILKDKVAIVTGAGSGIGKAIAELYAANGAKVVVSDINEQAAKTTMEAIKAAKGNASFVRADSSLAEDNEKLVRDTLQQYGGLHIACNNAGIGGPSAPVGEYPIDGWQKVININLSGVFYGMRYQIPAMLKSKGGAIVNMASILGQVGFAQSCAYVAAKHGVVGLTRNAALEYSNKGIRVNAIGPAFIDTPLLNSMTPEQKQWLVSLHPIGRLGKAEEVAELALWLSSDKASFVSGSYYAIDGGYLSQ